MSTRGAGLVVAVAGLLVGAAWLVWTIAGGTAADVDGVAADARPAADASPGSAEVGGTAPTGSPAQRTPVAVEERSPDAGPSSARPAVFRGRAVDEAGAPLRGVTAALHGWVASEDRRAHVARHGPIDWQDPAVVVTGPDGRFAISFVPPPPYDFEFELTADGMASVGGRWGGVDPGTVKDFGDVTLQPGALVRGRLVAGDGGPVPRPTGRVTLGLGRYGLEGSPRRELTTADMVWADLAADGGFVIREPVVPGTWKLVVQGLLPRARDAEVVVAAPRTDVDVAVFRPDELLRVVGSVVDQAGAPVARAEFEPIDVPRASEWILNADRDGRFEFEQRPDAVDPAAPFRLRFEREGYEPATTGELTFGQRDVRVVMKRIAAMEVLVVRAGDRQPVTEYGLRVMNVGGSRSSRERDVIDGWTHEAGIVRVRTMQRGGTKRIVVEPRGDSGLAPAETVVEVDVDAPPRLTIELPRAVAQVVQLQRADGSPAAGSRVELIDAGGEELNVISAVTAFDERGFGSSEVGLRIDHAETDARGRCEVSGPDGRPLTLRVFGEHPPVVVNGLRIGDAPLVLRVAAGATLRVTVDPAELLVEWRRAAGLPERGAVPDEHRSALPSVWLGRSLGGSQERVPLDRMMLAVPFDDSGVAVLRHVPPGAWTLTCEWHETPEGSRRSIRHPAQVELADGVDAEIVIDVSAYRAGTVSGTVSVDGAPAAAVQLTLRRPAVEPGPAGEPRFEQFRVRTDGDGAFECRLPAGAYRAFVLHRPAAGADERSPSVQLRAAPGFTVVVGEPTEVALRALVGRARLRFVDPGGQPVADLDAWAVGGDWIERPKIPPTDAQGVTTVLGNPGALPIACRARSVMNETALDERWQALLETHGGDHQRVQRELAGLVVELPPVVLTEGGGAELIEVRLPPDWDR